MPKPPQPGPSNRERGAPDRQIFHLGTYTHLAEWSSTAHVRVSCQGDRPTEARPGKWLPKVALLDPFNDHGIRDILCYYKGFLWRARGDSNTQPPDP